MLIVIPTLIRLGRINFIKHDFITYEILAEAQAYDSSSGTDYLGEFSVTQPQLAIPYGNLKRHKSILASIVTVLGHNGQRGMERRVSCDLDEF